MTDPKGKRMTAEELGSCLVVLDEGFPRITAAIANHIAALESRVTAAEELRDLTMKDRDEFRERAIAAEQRNAALEAQIATLREEREDARTRVLAATRGLDNLNAIMAGKLQAAEAQLAAITRPHSDEEVGKVLEWLDRWANGRETAMSTRAARIIRSLSLAVSEARGKGWSDALEQAANAARLAQLPEGYQWGRDALEQFGFGKQRAAEAIRALKPSGETKI